MHEHLADPLYRTGYYLILGTGLTGVLGVVFWAVAARSYAATVVGVNAAALSAMTLISGVCSLGLSAVLVRYLPVAGASARTIVKATYATTAGLSIVVGIGAAATSAFWSPSLSFLAEPAWIVGFAAATAATTVFTLQDSVLTGLRAAQWIPIENSLYATAKLVLLLALVGTLPHSGPFIAWNAPLLIAIVLVNFLIFGRLVRGLESPGTIDRRSVVRMAAGNYGGNLFSLIGNLFLPILVTNVASPAEAAYFYVPWLISLSLELVALNVTTSLTVEAALEPAQLRVLTRRALRHSMSMVIPLSVFTAVAAPWLLLIFGSGYADVGTPLLRVLILGMIPNVFVALGISVARIEHRGSILFVVPAVSCFLVLGISAGLLPRLGIVAVGVAWTATQALLAVCLLGGILRPLLSRRGESAVGDRTPSNRGGA
jgi:O-antigen/teichoic acid export membrane protein